MKVAGCRAALYPLRKMVNGSRYYTP